jgi:hypothetical protein
MLGTHSDTKFRRRRRGTLVIPVPRKKGSGMPFLFASFLRKEFHIGVIVRSITKIRLSIEIQFSSVYFLL